MMKRTRFISVNGFQVTIEHEGEGLRDWARYLRCRVVGHKPRPDGEYWFCTRCQDTLPQGNKRRQP